MIKLCTKRGISPIIGAVALILIIVILGALIFTFARDLIPQQVLLSGSPVELACPEINFEAGVFGADLEIINRGNIHIHGIELLSIFEGSIFPYEIITDLQPGQSTSQDISQLPIPSHAELKAKPILLGQTSGGKQVPFVCENSIAVSKN